MSNIIKLSNFELQTKIRFIINELLEATSNKLGQFNSRIELYQKFFLGFNDRVIRLQNQSKNQKKENTNLTQKFLQLQQKVDTLSSVTNEEDNKCKFMIQELKLFFSNIQAQHRNVKLISDKMVSQNLKTKNKFLEISKIINDTRSETTEKITKFVEQNIKINAEIKTLYNKIVSDLFSTNLSIQQQRKSYGQAFQQFNLQNKINNQQNQKLKQMENLLSQKLDESSIKQVINNIKEQFQKFMNQNDEKFQEKIQQKIMSDIQVHPQVIKLTVKVCELQKQFKQSQQQIQRMDKVLNKKINETQKFSQQLEGNFNKMKESSDKQIIKIHRQLKEHIKKLDELRLQSKVMKKQHQNTVYYMKTQLESKIKQKKESKSQKSGVSQQVILKFENQKNLKFQQFQNKIQAIQIKFQQKIQNLTRDNEQMIQQKLNAIKINNPSISMNQYVKKQLAELKNKLMVLQNDQKDIQTELKNKISLIEDIVNIIKQQTNKQLVILQNESNNMSKKNQEFIRKVQDKIQKISFMVTKIRGDIIIKTQFSTKQIKDLIKRQTIQCQKTNGLLKIVPAISQSINLIMSLLYDKQYQVSRIIQDNLPKSVPERFITLSQGILYQFKQKRKGGTIYYRHRQIKKIQIIKATFISLIEIWENLLQNQFKQKLDFFPKGFYKSVVEKKIALLKDLPQEKQIQLEIHKSISMNTVQNSKKELGHHQSDKKLQQTMNKSFNIRHKYNNNIEKLKPKEQFFTFDSPNRKNVKTSNQKLNF